MSVKEFECSGIHDLFKVSFIRPCVFSVSFQNKKSNFPSSMYRLCQNFILRPARLRNSLQTEAKTAKDKAKELNNEILLKKGEVLRLTKDFNRL